LTEPWQVDRDPGAGEPAGDGGNTPAIQSNLPLKEKSNEK